MTLRLLFLGAFIPHVPHWERLRAPDVRRLAAKALRGVVPITIKGLKEKVKQTLTIAIDDYFIVD